MNITTYWSENYRNLASFEMNPCETINIIYGENGQGKTNLLESIWLFTGCNSFRTHNPIQLVRHGAQQAKISMEFQAHGYDRYALLEIGKTRNFTLNGVPKKNARAFLGEFQAVVFSPLSLQVVNGGPAERRRFLDIAVSLIRPVYAADLIRYQKIMQNRNALLRQISQGEADAAALDVWDQSLAALGGKLTRTRLDYIEKLTPIAAEIYGKISGGREKFSLAADSAAPQEHATAQEIAAAMEEQLKKTRETDLRRYMTSVGPHRDDLIFYIDDSNVRSYASQGQQRSAALAMKIAEAYLMREIAGESPVILLDDVMSELDLQRQRCLLQYLSGWQVFVTCCDPANLSAVEDCKLFKVRNGSID